MKNKIFQKIISIDSVFYTFDPEIGLHFYFPYKPFPNWRAKRERERERERRDHSLTHSLHPLPHTELHLQTISRKFLSSLTLITHAKPKPKDEESYRRWSLDPVLDPRLRRSDHAAQTHRWSDRAASNPSLMNLVWSCSPLPSPPPCDLASRSNPVASTARSHLRLCRAISPQPSCLSLFLLLSIWPNLMIFFFLSFVSFVFLGFDEYYIFVWKLRKCE